MDLRGRLAKLVLASLEETQAKSNLKWNAHFSLGSIPCVNIVGNQLND